MFLHGSSSSGGGSLPPKLDDQIAAYVATLTELHQKLDPQGKLSDDPELAMLQLDWLKQATWGGLDPIARYCVPLLVEHGREIDPEHMNDCLDIACDEHVVKGHQLILRRHLDRMREHNWVGLGELAEEVFNPKSEQYDDYRKKLRRNYLYPMRDLGLWSVTEEGAKIARTGTKFHGGFKITAGHVLMAFHRHIYMPWTIRHAEFACQIIEQLKQQTKGQ